MIEIPESETLAAQITGTLQGKRIASVVAAYSLHKFAWFNGDPTEYDGMLRGRRIGVATGRCASVEIEADEIRILLGDGAAVRYHKPDEKLPKKHQLLIEFEDGSHLVTSVQMYGGIWVFEAGRFDNPYYRMACEKPQPITDSFTREYFESLFSTASSKSEYKGEAAKIGKLSLKAFLATEQRIPGLGNGVLQDILFNARLHPKKKVATLSDGDRNRLYSAVTETLATMTAQGGRDTERDLYGNYGDYTTILSKKTVGTPCPSCGQTIQKAAHLGGSVYFCPECQEM